MKSHKKHSVALADRIPNRQLIAYGFGGMIPIALFNIAGQLMSLIGNIGLGLSAFLLGVIMIIPRLWDAVSDPLMGHISDNIRTPWGRRRPFLLIGGIAVAISFVLMWWIPDHAAVSKWFETPESYDWFQLGYIMFWLLVFFTSCTIFEIPHGALGMEMSADPHERTRLFSAKSFLGSLFAMATPWLLLLANMDVFKGTGGSTVDGMRWVSMMIAAFLIPMSIWWFIACREPSFEVVKKQKKEGFWKSMRVVGGNRTFHRLVIIIFTLAMGFNFVGLLNYYITIFYLYGGDVAAAGPLLGINGTVWAVTGLLAVFPLNWISPRLGKKATLGWSITLMFVAQVSKIFCYNPDLPYLVIIPTVLLSAGMLMLFTLGSSMLGDVCDEDDLNTGSRSEGSYYSVYWWFIKLGTAFASLVTGTLIVLSQFDEKQSKVVDTLKGSIELAHEGHLENDSEKIEKYLLTSQKSAAELVAYFEGQTNQFSNSSAHYEEMLLQAGDVENQVREFSDPSNHGALNEFAKKVSKLKLQSPTAMLRLRIFEIGIPLLLCAIALWLLKFYPLTDERAYEVKSLLDERNKKLRNK